MNDLQRYLTQNFAGALDRMGDHMENSGPMSIDDIKRMMPLVMDATLAQWAASLDIKTKHEMLKKSIDGIH